MSDGSEFDLNKSYFVCSMIGKDRLEIIKGKVIKVHPTNNSLWLVKCGEFCVWVINKFIYSDIQEAIACYI